MSHVELLEAQGSAWSYGLVGLLFLAFLLGGCWFALHGGQHLLTIWRRGRVYRTRMRAARHVAPRFGRQRVAR